MIIDYVEICARLWKKEMYGNLTYKEEKILSGLENWRNVAFAKTFEGMDLKTFF